MKNKILVAPVDCFHEGENMLVIDDGLARLETCRQQASRATLSEFRNESR